MAASYFIADLHLSSATPARLGLLERLVAEIAAGETLYILGDLFDRFAGRSAWNTPEVRQVVTVLRAARGRGVGLFFLPGNRDFQATRFFARDLGAQTATDFVARGFGSRRAYLTHGDLLCTADLAYQRFRRVIRGRLVARLADAVPAALARAAAAGLRATSRRAVAEKPPEALRLTAGGLRRAFDAGCDVVVCGHVHRLGHFRGVVDGARRDLYVLGEWRDGGNYLRHDGADGWTFGDLRP
ncbi:MAG: UDP-2,3-diacylglucosamine diphosphatase [Planctomycetes bacterium]|nr:UDP-2,3-diacylglucosamine diphosphatase [Planctomycetota bacterium]